MPPGPGGTGPGDCPRSGPVAGVCMARNTVSPGARSELEESRQPQTARRICGLMKFGPDSASTLLPERRWQAYSERRSRPRGVWCATARNQFRIRSITNTMKRMSSPGWVIAAMVAALLSVSTTRAAASVGSTHVIAQAAHGSSPPSRPAHPHAPALPARPHRSGVMRLKHAGNGWRAPRMGTGLASGQPHLKPILRVGRGHAPEGDPVNPWFDPVRSGRGPPRAGPFRDLFVLAFAGLIPAHPRRPSPRVERRTLLPTPPSSRSRPLTCAAHARRAVAPHSTRKPEVGLWPPPRLPSGGRGSVIISCSPRRNP